ncbi:Uncharacterised protein [uncultured archaeon]|nr:Uncharacterised protein [uncultured archaeon]
MSNKFNIIECKGILNRSQLEMLLAKLPISFKIVDESINPAEGFRYETVGEMQAYHSARVISLFPLQFKRLSNAVVTDRDFPFRPDNIMDDNIGLRCCYHPKLTSFDIPAVDNWDEIEIDIHKFPHESRDRKYV